MGVIVPTTQQVFEDNLATFESNLNQESPLADIAFLRVLSSVEAGNFTLLNRYAAYNVEQTLALTAGLERLKVIGANHNVPYIPAVSAIIECEIDGLDSLSLPAFTIFVADANGLRYETNAIANGGLAPYTFEATCKTLGVAGNLVIGNTLVIGSPVTGFESTATVTEVDPAINSDLRVGVDDETLEAYRRRVLNEIRTVGGGGNGVDYRTWGEETTGVRRISPYSAAPLYPIPDFLDGDMEAVGTGSWGFLNNAVLTKETTTPYSGARCLRVAYGGPADGPIAYQSALEVGKRYRITGWARGDGTYFPVVMNTLDKPIWLGTIGNTWQEIDSTFEAIDTRIMLVAYVVGGPGYCEFDDFTITQVRQPGDRTIFVEGTDPPYVDGLADQALLDDTRQNINYNPIDGKSRPPLGLTDETLFMLSITRTTIYTEIRGLSVPPDVEAQVKADIDVAVIEYLSNVVPFIDGTDPIITRNDKVTDLTMSQVIQDILTPVGGSADGIGIGTQPFVFISSYQLGQGEMVKASVGGVTYVP